VRDTPLRDLARCAAGSVDRILHRLDELLAADRLLAEVAQEVPQEVLERNLERV
jgi:hypothetical protein